MHFREIYSPPNNLQQFVEEMRPEYERLYGQTAAKTYANQAPAQIGAAIRHPDIRTFAMMENTNAHALLLLRAAGGRQIIPFFHVRHDAMSPAEGAAFLDQALHRIANTTGELLITEYIPFCDTRVDAVYQSHGFQRVDRQLMESPKPGSAPPASTGLTVTPATDEHIDALAGVFASAYEDHPERPLYAEAANKETARTFLRQCARGTYGAYRTGYLLGAWTDTRCVGMAAGAEVVAGLGFVLHMAVLPACQNRGVGAQLLHALTARFAAEGLERAALAVTCDNPAVRLYARSGFEITKEFAVYYRLRGCI